MSWEEIQKESADWQKEYEQDRYNRIRAIALEEQERILAENANRYEREARADHSADELLKTVCPELFGDEG